VTVTFAYQWALGYCAFAQWITSESQGGRPDMNLNIPSATIAEQQDAVLCARVYANDNTIVVQADVLQVLVRVYDVSGTEVYGKEEDPADVIYNTLQTDARWTEDGTGYNLRVTIPGRGVFLSGGANYGTEIILEMADGDAIAIRGTLRITPLGAYKLTQTQ
jgi:hypothetical protein